MYILQPIREQHPGREQLHELPLLAVLSHAGQMQRVQPGGGSVNVDGTPTNGMRTPGKLHSVLPMFRGCKNIRHQASRDQLPRISRGLQPVPPVPRKPRRRRNVLEETPNGRKTLPEEH